MKELGLNESDSENSDDDNDSEDENNEDNEEPQDILTESEGEEGEGKQMIDEGINLRQANSFFKGEGGGGNHLVIND